MHQDLEENMAIAQTDMKKILLELQSMVSEIRENEDEVKRQVAKILKRNVTQEFVKSIIELQFNIKWKTETGEPADYTYYEFCDNTNTTKLLKYIPRQAHVKATPYKKCRNDTDDRLKGITQKQLCPTVYIRTTEKWKTWEPENDKFKDVEATWSLCM